MLKSGDRVICIDARFNSECRPYMPCWILQGARYTIRGIHKDPDIEGYGVYLWEVINPEQIWSNDKPREWSFNSNRFVLDPMPHSLPVVETRLVKSPN